MSSAPTTAAGSTPSEDFSVGRFRVYPSEHLLLGDGEPVQLEPKVMALLVYLAQNAGRTLSRAQLFEAVWPGVIVSDDTLTQAVTKLRKVFRDDARNPRYIQTVPKRGYRLCAAVEFAAEAAPAAAVRSKSRAQSLVLGALVLLVTVIVLATVVDRWESGLPEPAPTSQATNHALPTLTVGPFMLLGSDESQAYLADGLRYELITDLSKLSGLVVIGSRSVMGQNADLPPLSAAQYLVRGDVQRMDDELRIHVHLLDTQSGRQLWSARYLEPIDNLFQIQESVSRQIVSTLAIKVGEEEKWRLARHYTTSVPAYELFLRAKSLLLVRQPGENEAARGLFRQAIEIDPSFARAYGGLALSFAADFRNQWAPDGDAALERANTMARTALEIDPTIPEVHWVLAYVSAQKREHETAIGLLRKAVSLDRSFADGYALMGGIKTYMGRPAETLPLIREAIRLNPDAGYLYFLLLGRAYFFLGDWEQALINLNEALGRNPTNLETRIYLAVTHRASGHHDEAAWQREEILSRQAGFSSEAWLRTYPMADRQQLTQLSSLFEQLRL